MRRKLVVLFLALLMTSTAIAGIFNHRNGTINIASAAEGSGGGDGRDYQPIINYSYVWEKTDILSKIVFNHSKGRAFGTPGEHIAANRIQDWMNETLGSENVTREKINETLKKGYITLRGRFILGILSSLKSGVLSKNRIVDAHWINITVEGTDKYWNFSYEKEKISSCFPFLARKIPSDDIIKVNGKTYYIRHKKNLKVSNKPVLFKRFCSVLYTDWENPYHWKTIYCSRIPYFIPLNRPRCKAFILVDKDFNDTYFMGPSYEGFYAKPGYSINGSKWREIEREINSGHKVKAEIYSKWHYDNVTSYNIIGELKGRDPSNVVDIVCAHYDCWWNQGTIDEAAETALVLGIAKYMKELEEEKGIKPEHTVKFIAFGGEEVGFRGSLDYIIKHNKKGEEIVRYVINPGNFGHNNSKGYPFKIGSDREFLRKIGENIAHALDYHNRFVWGVEGSSKIEAEDSKAFYALGEEKGVVQFGRGYFKGYHRDGSNHTKGDVLYPNKPFWGLNDTVFKVESDIVLLTALYLCYEDIIKENLTILNSNPVTFDSGKDGRHDSVRIHFNVSSVIPTGAKIRVDLFYANNSNNWSDSLTHTYTRYFLIGENGTAHGSVVLSLPSTESPGQYKAKLKLYDVNGTLVDEDETDKFYLNLLDIPIADFTYSPSNPTDIDDITFNAKDHSYPSAGENPRIVNYTWNFGDGSYEYGGIVTHRYADDGYYNVTLTIIDTNGKNASITKQIYVRNVPPSVDFTISPCKIVAVGEPVIFNSTIYEPDGYIINYTWDFGDGSYSYTRNATHVYTESGFYKVKFTAMDDDNDTGTKTKWIWVFDGIVDDDYPRDDPANRRWKGIQNAIDYLGNNSMIYVYNGTYNESLLINKTIRLYGENNRGVIVSNDNVVIDVLSNGSLEIHNFTIRNGTTGIRIANAKLGSIISNCILHNKNGITIYNTSCNEIENCRIHGGDIGIRITDSEDNFIENCIINGMDDGIYMEGSSYNMIRKCSMKLNTNSIYLYNSDKNIVDQCYIEVKNRLSFLPCDSGIKMVQSDDNTITVCNISNATSHGIYLALSSRNHINLCNFYENGYGVYLVASSENEISSCNFINNTGPGVTIDSASTNNSIFYNNFIFNGVTREGIIQAYDAGNGNRWYLATAETLVTNSSYGEGNFWFDYTGNDTNGDGIGDTPYNISGPSCSRDLYPLIDVCRWDEWFGINWGSRDDPWVEAPTPEFYLN